MRIKSAQPKHKAFRDDLVAVLKKHGDDLTAPEMLALSAHPLEQMTGETVTLREMILGQLRDLSTDEARVQLALHDILALVARAAASQGTGEFEELEALAKVFDGGAPETKDAPAKNVIVYGETCAEYAKAIRRMIASAPPAPAPDKDK